MKSQLIHGLARTHRVVRIAAAAILLVLADHRDGVAAQSSSKSAADSGPHIIKAGTRVLAKPLRKVCGDDYAVGDTVTAEVRIGRTLLAGPMWWPKKFTVLLQRRAPQRPAERLYPPSTLLQVTIDGRVVRGAQGTFTTDVEWTYSDNRQAGALCFGAFDGVLTRTIRVR